MTLAPCGTALCGRVTWLDRAAGGPLVDRHNPDPALRRRPVCGIEILRDFRLGAVGEWVGGRVYNPNDGQEWRVTLATAGPDRLRLRGYVLVPLFGQTQVWSRAPANFAGDCRQVVASGGR